MRQGSHAIHVWSIICWIAIFMSSSLDSRVLDYLQLEITQFMILFVRIWSDYRKPITLDQMCLHTFLSWNTTHSNNIILTTNFSGPRTLLMNTWLRVEEWCSNFNLTFINEAMDRWVKNLLIEIVDIQRICAPVTRLDGHGKY